MLRKLFPLRPPLIFCQPSGLVLEPPSRCLVLSCRVLTPSQPDCSGPPRLFFLRWAALLPFASRPPPRQHNFPRRDFTHSTTSQFLDQCWLCVAAFALQLPSPFFFFTLSSHLSTHPLASSHHHHQHLASGVTQHQHQLELQQPCLRQVAPPPLEPEAHAFDAAKARRNAPTIPAGLLVETASRATTTAICPLRAMRICTARVPPELPAQRAPPETVSRPPAPGEPATPDKPRLVQRNDMRPLPLKSEFYFHYFLNSLCCFVVQFLFLFHCNVPFSSFWGCCFCFVLLFQFIPARLSVPSPRYPPLPFALPWAGFACSALLVPFASGPLSHISLVAPPKPSSGPCRQAVFPRLSPQACLRLSPTGSGSWTWATAWHHSPQFTGPSQQSQAAHLLSVVSFNRRQSDLHCQPQSTLRRHRPAYFRP